MRYITENEIEIFQKALIDEERAEATVNKYMHDIRSFFEWLNNGALDKSTVLAYKAKLKDEYKATSVNSKLSSINHFFACLDWHELRVKALKIQREIFASTERELTRQEYERLLLAAKQKNNERLYLLMQTICSTGIRVSELKFVTVEALARRRAEISCKGKRRTVFLPDRLCAVLTRYVRTQKIKSGSVFVSKNGNPLNRSNIWTDMRKLCKSANVSETKVFPHNLRHLFARAYYTMEKDIVRLADILGHASIDTTRIYTMESGEIHREKIQKLGLLLC